MTVDKPTSLGAFLAREHGLQQSTIPTTAPTFISDFDSNYDNDDWCVINNDSDESNGKTDQLSQRINSLETVSRELLSRIHQLESKQATVSAAAPSLPKQLPAINKREIEYHSSKFAKLHGKSLKSALIMQRQKILGKNKSKSKNKRFLGKKTEEIRTSSYHSLFQKELALRVQNPGLKQSWHILRSRKIEDPHAAALTQLRREMMIAKSHLKNVPSPDCKTVIILD